MPNGTPVARAANRRASDAAGEQAENKGSSELFELKKAVGQVRTTVLIDRSWLLMLPTIVMAVFCGVLAVRELPPLSATLGILTAACIILVSNHNKISRFEGGAAPAVRVGVTIFAVGLPMFLTGFAFSYWSVSGDLPWRLALPCLVGLSTIAAALLQKRRAHLIASQIGCWSAVTIIEASLLGVTGLVIAIGASTFISVKESRAEKKRLQYEEEHRRKQDRAVEILREYEQAGEGWFWETDRSGRLTYVSEPTAKALGASADELFKRPFSELFSKEQDDRESERTLGFHLSARSQFNGLVLRAATEEERWWSVTGRPIYDQFDNFVGFRGSGADLTEKRLTQERASRLAHYDVLTGLANRFQMSQSLEKILSAPNEMQRACSVFLLDLDRFKQVNDSLGHPAGDALLKQVADRLKSTVGNKGRVGRLGGDEFQVIVPGSPDREMLGYLARDIIHSLSQPYQIEGQRVVIGVSVGIALSPDDGVTSESIIRNADLALYAAKDAGRGRLHFYANDLHSAAEERNQLENDLRDAIANGELELFYQPVVSTATEEITGFEALIRWDHPKRGWLPPEKFIAVAEDAGLITAIGEWAIRTACHALTQWPENVRCAVNVSPLQFANLQLPNVIAQAVAQAGIAPSRLELEITESVFLSDDEGTDAMFAALKRVGVRLALDDFGTGYSSLGYLKKAPFNKIKIDQSFVHGATQPGSHNGAIIASITSLAQSLGMDTTAEGVETLDELDLVRVHGCSHVQGYIYARPLDKERVGDLLGRGLVLEAKGPRSARPSRRTTLRRVVLENAGQYYPGTIRNVSVTGALVEGLWNVPVGTKFRIALSDEETVEAECRWCEDNRMGVNFSEPMEAGEDGTVKLPKSELAAMGKAGGTQAACG